jgi:4'-phosphopantetheinyl transferase
MGLATIRDLPEIREGILGIWELTETGDSLLQNLLLTQTELQELENISNEKRKREYLSVRILLHEMLKAKGEICYNTAGKPYLPGYTWQLSIAHSQELAVIVLSGENAGADVESLSRDTDKIASRFLSEEELQNITVTSDPKLSRIIYWSAKEAAYKYASIEGLEFKSHIKIQPFLVSMDGGHFEGMISQNNFQMNICFSYFFYNNDVVVYCYEAKNNLKKQNLMK